MKSRACIGSIGLSASRHPPSLLRPSLPSRISPTPTPDTRPQSLAILERTEPTCQLSAGAKSFSRMDCLSRGPADTMLVG